MIARILEQLRVLLIKLKRRKVYHVGVTYVVIGWVLIDGAETIFPQLELPAWSVKLITALIVFGFPVALILAWAYELTPGGIRRDHGENDPVGPQDQLEILGGQSQQSSQQQQRPSRSIGGVVALTALMLIVAGGWYATKALFEQDGAAAGAAVSAEASGAGARADEGESGADLRSGEGEPDRRVVAVLPIEHHSSSAEEDRYLSDGLTEALISTLMEMRELSVIASTSVMRYRDAEADVEQIAGQLGAGTVIEGAVQRAGDQMAITVRMVDVVNDETKLLGNFDHAFEVDRVLTVQREVAQRVAEALSVELGVERRAAVAEAPASSLEAHKAYLRGLYTNARQSWARRTVADVRRSIALFEEAIEEEEEEGYAKAYAGLADAYIILGYLGGVSPAQAYPEAKKHAERALEIDPNLAEAYNAKAYANYAYFWRWEEAEGQFKRALELNPSYATAYHWYGWYLQVMGRHGEAVEALGRAQRLDPESLMIPVSLAACHYFEANYDKAVAIYRKVLERDPGFLMAQQGLGQTYVQQGKLEEAVRVLREAVESEKSSASTVAALGYAEAIAGQADRARDRLEHLRALASRDYVPAAFLAQVHVGLGEHGEALESLSRAIEQRSEYVLTVPIDPIFRPLRDAPAYETLMERIDLPGR